MSSGKQIKTMDQLLEELRAAESQVISTAPKEMQEALEAANQAREAYWEARCKEIEVKAADRALKEISRGLDQAVRGSSSNPFNSLPPFT